MGKSSNIEWTDDTWNPWRGCTKVSPGCLHCYAETLTLTRLGGEWGKGRPRIRHKTLNDPIKWNKKPWVCDECSNIQPDNPGPAQMPCIKCHCAYVHRRRVFSLSLGDWLDDEVSIEWLSDMLCIMRRCPNLDFLLLSKRPEHWRLRLENSNRRLAIIGSEHGSDEDKTFQWVSNWLCGSAPSNVWIGVSIEDQKRADERIPKLLDIPAAVRFLSIEPLLEPIDFSKWLVEIHSTGDPKHPLQARNVPRWNWAIVGGESGDHRRDCGVSSIVNVAEQCVSAGIACFVKQDCAFRPGQQGRIPDEIFALKQFPTDAQFTKTPDLFP